MKVIKFTRKGRHYKIYHDTTEESINNVLSEVFIDECYKKGLDWIKKINNPVVVDLGAYVGDTILYFKQCKDVTIYGLEPCRENFDCLLRTVDGMKRVSVFNNGILNHIGKMDLDKGKTHGSGGESLFNLTDDTEEISVVDIATFMETLKIDHIDLLKIDVEGAEYEIFGGPHFEKINRKIGAIIGETHLKPALPIIAEQMLKDYGYKFEWLPYKNLHYGWHGKFGKWEKNVEVNIPSLFFAHR